MKPPECPANERLRLDALRTTGLLDTPTEERFDRLTRLARRVFSVPIALVSLVDENRQWFKSCQGLNVRETPRNISFCGHTILGEEVMVVPDAKADPNFADNPLVTETPNIRFYAGYPLKVADGYRLGTLCIIDNKPRQLSDEDLSLLRDLGRIVEEELLALQLVATDELTGLSNRRGFTVMADNALSICQRLQRPAALLFFDIDRFKAINDSFGHAEGDRALCAFAEILRDTFRSCDVLGRLCGDEFAVFLSGYDALDRERVLARMDECVRRFNADPERDYPLAYSVGFVTLDSERHSSLDEMLAEADRLMYAHKAAKRH